MALPARPFLVSLVALTAAGCAASSPVAYRDLASAPQLQPARDDDAPFQYRSPTAALGSYTSLIIDPVAVYAGPDAQFGSTSAADRRAIAAYLGQTFATALASVLPVVDKPGPGTLRLHLVLTGLEASTPVVSTLTHLAPFGLVLNTGLEAAGGNGTFFGSVSYAVELSDAVTGALVYAYVTRQTPDALDVTASLGTLDAARTGVRIGARKLREALAKARTAGLPQSAS